MRFRSFTILRSPLVLAHSQFNYWHHASAVPRQLYYQLSPEMLLFQDTLKLINDQGPVCHFDEDGLPSGGNFIALQPPGLVWNHGLRGTPGRSRREGTAAYALQGRGNCSVNS